MPGFRKCFGPRWHYFLPEPTPLIGLMMEPILKCFLCAKPVVKGQLFFPFLRRMQLGIRIGTKDGKRGSMFFILRHARCIHLHQPNFARRAAT